MTRFILSLSLLLLSFSCCCRQMNEVALETCEQIRHENNQRLARQGFHTLNDGYCYPSTIYCIKGSYVTQRYQFNTLDAANAFMHSFVRDYLKPFNEDTCIRPYLHTFPLTAKNVELAILFTDAEGAILNPPYIASIRLVKDTLYYDIYDKSTKEYSPVRKEPFNSGS